MNTHANDQVFKWLNNIPLSAFICPLCDDTSNGCQCYRDVSSSDLSTPHTASSDLLAIHLADSQINSYSLASELNGEQKSPGTKSLGKAVDDKDDSSSTGSGLIRGCSVEIVKWTVTGADLLLKVGSTLFPVHRTILSEHSAVFKQKLNNSEKLVIEVPVKARHFQTVLEYLYNHEIILNKSNASEILRIAEMYEMSSLLESCNNYIQRSSHLRFLKKQKRWKIIHDILGFKIF